MFNLKLLDLANMALWRIEIRTVATPHLQVLSRRTGLTVHMAILEGRSAVLVEKIEPPGPYRMATWVGRHLDAHCTGVGKSLLAWLPEEELRQFIKGYGLNRHNENTIASASKLKDELTKVRERGYAVDDEEDEIGLRGIGTPIIDCAAKVVAAISVAGTTAQVCADNLTQLAQEVRQTAHTISQQLGAPAVFGKFRKTATG